MAFRSNNPISLMLPPFRGVTRRIILIALVEYLGMAVLGLFSEQFVGLLLNFFRLHPSQALHPQIWQLVSYPFVGYGLISVAFALLSLWFFATTLEDERGSRWLGEYFLVTTIVGGVLAVLLSLAGARIPGLGPDVAAEGMWPAVLAVMVAYGVLHAEEQVQFNFLFSLKAKYLAAIYVLFYLALALVGGDRFGALVALCNGGVGYGFLKLAPRRGFRVGISERLFAMRNAYYRVKRRRAAKKFTVYMKKQGKDVSVDEDGRYVDPKGEPRDPNDRRWMN
ncbi:MAG: rhomboid family intramembrane serine protease [Acidobacteriaceae bacterium]